MREPNADFTLTVTGTRKRCPVGESTGAQYMTEKKTPILSCAGACIRGEIARIAANMVVSKNDRFRHACHGEVLTVPGSGFDNWVTAADKVILIDGCFMRCWGRILENLLPEDRLVQFDALSHYKKYTNVFDIEAVPESERNQAAQSVAQWVLASIELDT
ncbi:MAG: putative zinc-binding protein [Candidatus Thorarchaeota archaeon]